MGIDVTHLDAHMGTVMHPKFLLPYVDLAIEFRLPIFFIRPSERRLQRARRRRGRLRGTDGEA